MEACTEQAHDVQVAGLNALGPGAGLNEICLILIDFSIDFVSCSKVCDGFNCKEEAASFSSGLTESGCSVPSLEEFCVEVNGAEDNATVSSFVNPTLAVVAIASCGFIN